MRIQIDVIFITIRILIQISFYLLFFKLLIQLTNSTVFGFRVCILKSMNVRVTFLILVYLICHCSIVIHVNQTSDIILVIDLFFSMARCIF